MTSLAGFDPFWTRHAVFGSIGVGNGQQWSHQVEGEVKWAHQSVGRKRGHVHAAEALECLGGNGYVEESRMPRLFRESPLASIWEGSGNVAALDTLRAVAKQPETLDALFDEFDAAAGADAGFDRFVAGVKAKFAHPETVAFRARSVRDLALALQSTLLIKHGHPAVADAFTASRLDREWGTVFGTLSPGIDTAAILDRSTPTV